MTTEPIEGEVISRELVASAPMTLYGTNEPASIVEQATKQATVLAKIIKDQKLSTNIGGRHHVRVEGWTTCGALVGVFPVLVWSRRVEDGWEARVEARTMAGAVVGAAEAECLRSERTWSTRDDYALRSMAQTRATSKALRQPLGWIVTLAGFDPTPEEEMPREEAPRRAASAAIPGGQERPDVAERPPHGLRPGNGVEAAKPANISDWWADARKVSGWTAEQITTYAGKAPIDMTPEERTTLLERLKVEAKNRNAAAGIAP